MDYQSNNRLLWKAKENNQFFSSSSLLVWAKWFEIIQRKIKKFNQRHFWSENNWNEDKNVIRDTSLTFVFPRKSQAAAWSYKNLNESETECVCSPSALKGVRLPRRTQFLVVRPPYRSPKTPGQPVCVCTVYCHYYYCILDCLIFFYLISTNAKCFGISHIYILTALTFETPYSIISSSFNYFPLCQLFPPSFPFVN